MILDFSVSNLSNIKDQIKSIELTKGEKVIVVCESISLEMLLFFNELCKKDILVEVFFNKRKEYNEICSEFINESYDYLYQSKLGNSKLFLEIEAHVNRNKLQIFENKNESINGGVIIARNIIIMGAANLRKSNIKDIIQITNSDSDLCVKFIERLRNESVCFNLDIISQYYTNNFLKEEMLLFNLLNLDIENEYLEIRKNLKDKGIKESKIWKSLFNYQEEGALSLIFKMDNLGGAILSDSVGLGKTYQALAIMKYYQALGLNSLVLVPKKLEANWRVYNSKSKNGEFSDDELDFKLLHHTSLTSKKVDNIPIENYNFSKYGVLVIDEAHAFKNSKSLRYIKLLELILSQNTNIKVLLLSATPINNGLDDLESLIKIISKNKNNVYIFKNISSSEKRTVNLSKLIKRTKKEIELGYDQNKINNDFKTLISSYFVNRNREYIKKHYNSDIFFPKKNVKDLLVNKSDTDVKFLHNQITTELRLPLYNVLEYVDKSKLSGEDNRRLGREKGMKALITMLLLKRFDSSYKSFILTIDSMIKRLETSKECTTLKEVESNKYNLPGIDDEETNDLIDTQFSTSNLHLNSNFYNDCENDIRILKGLKHNNNFDIYDLNKKTIVENVIKDVLKSEQKVIVFSTYEDTILELFNHLQSSLNTNIGVISGNTSRISYRGKSNLDVEVVLNEFKSRKSNLNVLLATDVLSEGQNLQVASSIIHYDIHWNPVKLIQREGRIDRVGSTEKYISMYYCWPVEDIENYIKLYDKVNVKSNISEISGQDSFRGTKKTEIEPHKLSYESDDIDLLLTLKGNNFEIEEITKKKELINILDIRMYIDLIDTLKTSKLGETFKELKDVTREVRGVMSILENSGTDNHMIVLIKSNNTTLNDNSISPFKLFLYDINNSEIISGEPEYVLEYQNTIITKEDVKLVDVDVHDAIQNYIVFNEDSFYRHAIKKIADSYYDIDGSNDKYFSIVSVTFNLSASMIKNYFKHKKNINWDMYTLSLTGKSFFKTLK